MLEPIHHSHLKCLKGSHINRLLLSFSHLFSLQSGSIGPVCHHQLTQLCICCISVFWAPAKQLWICCITALIWPSAKKFAIPVKALQKIQLTPNLQAKPNYYWIVLFTPQILGVEEKLLSSFRRLLQNQVAYFQSQKQYGKLPWIHLLESCMETQIQNQTLKLVSCKVTQN